MQLISSSQRRNALLKRAALIGVILVMATGGVAAQTGDVTTNPICNDDSNLSVFRPVMNGALQASIFIGVAGGIVSFFGSTAMESLPVGAERREAMKQFEGRARGAALKLLFGGAIFTFILGGVFDISCLNLIPF
ncbi:hypothetical protein C435_11415 [Haloarcula marismortui ATCC 33799]|uniref:Uncharacterized protein n=2 Tax=Haloarcula marismortui TaxID=2238 RepID=M0K7W8_9EURY|nr:hypothetical protein C435_11415 [Haloarcula californiae ATCC 33799]